MPARKKTMITVPGCLLFAVPSLANHSSLAKTNPFNLANDRARHLYSLLVCARIHRP